MDDSDTISVNAYNTKEFPTLPYNGWLKPCTNRKCRIITGQYIIYNFYGHKFKYYFCSPCRKHFNCVDYIEKHYTQFMNKKTIIDFVNI